MLKVRRMSNVDYRNKVLPYELLTSQQINNNNDIMTFSIFVHCRCSCDVCQINICANISEIFLLCKVNAPPETNSIVYFTY